MQSWAVIFLLNAGKATTNSAFFMHQSEPREKNSLFTFEDGKKHSMDEFSKPDDKEQSGSAETEDAHQPDGNNTILYSSASTAVLSFDVYTFLCYCKVTLIKVMYRILQPNALQHCLLELQLFATQLRQILLKYLLGSFELSCVYTQLSPVTTVTMFLELWGPKNHYSVLSHCNSVV